MPASISTFSSSEERADYLDFELLGQPILSSENPTAHTLWQELFQPSGGWTHHGHGLEEESESDVSDEASRDSRRVALPTGAIRSVRALLPDADALPLCCEDVMQSLLALGLPNFDEELRHSLLNLRLPSFGRSNDYSIGEHPQSSNVDDDAQDHSDSDSEPLQSSTIDREPSRFDSTVEFLQSSVINGVQETSDSLGGPLQFSTLDLTHGDCPNAVDFLQRSPTQLSYRTIVDLSREILHNGIRFSHSDLEFSTRRFIIPPRPLLIICILLYLINQPKILLVALLYHFLQLFHRS